MMALAAAGAAALATSAAAAAQEDPWRVTDRDTGCPGDCCYKSYEQCWRPHPAAMPINPRVAFGGPVRPRDRCARYYPHGAPSSH